MNTAKLGIAAVLTCTALVSYGFIDAALLQTPIGGTELVSTRAAAVDQHQVPQAAPKRSPAVSSVSVQHAVLHCQVDSEGAPRCWMDKRAKRAPLML